jgi:hypothetical protein
MKTPSHSIEILETRIAPAATFTYFDFDGDKVTITTSKGTNADLAAVLFFDSAIPDSNRQLRAIDLSLNAVFAGTNLSITARLDPERGGDGLVNVGRIDADLDGGDVSDTALDLGVVKIKGDLGELDAGDSDLETRAVRVLSVQSLGQFGLFTQGGFGSLVSNFAGSLGKLTVAGSIVEAYVRVGGGGNLGSVMVGGSIRGENLGLIYADGKLGAVKVKGDLVGGGGSFSGSIGAGSAVGAVTIGGSVLGGGGDDSGSIYAGFLAISDMGPVKIGLDVKGGAGQRSGVIAINTSGGKIASVTIGHSLIGDIGTDSGSLDIGAAGPVKIGGDILGSSGAGSGSLGGTTIASVRLGRSLIGGSATGTGVITAQFGMGPVKIGGDIVGGDSTGADVFNSGVVTGERIASVMVGGSIVAGTRTVGSELRYSGAVFADDDLGRVTIKGSLIGNESNPALIMANVTIKSLTVGGRVEWANILADYRALLTGGPLSPPAADNADAQIGAVTVGGDWIASNLVAGVQDDDDGLLDDHFGDGDDQPIAGGVPEIISKIARVVIKGHAFGTLDNATDSFGFVAQHVGFLSVAGTKLPLRSGPTNDMHPVFVGIALDMNAREMGPL